MKPLSPKEIRLRSDIEREQDVTFWAVAILILVWLLGLIAGYNASVYINKEKVRACIAEISMLEDKAQLYKGKCHPCHKNLDRR